MEILHPKIGIRETALRRRREITASDRLQASTVIGEKVFLRPEYTAAKVVCLYVSLADEVDTSGIMRQSLTHKQVVIPKVHADGTLRLHTTSAPEELTPGAFGILEPAGENREVMATAIDLFIIPGVAFDRLGGRIGHGHGYYDRLLQQVHVPIMGLAFSEQIVPDTYAESHDVRVNVVITEKEVIEIC